MKKLSGMLLQAFAVFGLAIMAACTANPTAGNKNQTTDNANLQTTGNSPLPQPAPPVDKTPAKEEQTGAGSIEVTSKPPGARVILISLDEEGAEPQQKGSTPVTLTAIPAGKYTVDIEKPGYKFYQKNIKVLDKKTTQVSAYLQKE